MERDTPCMSFPRQALTLALALSIAGCAVGSPLTAASRPGGARGLAAPTLAGQFPAKEGSGLVASKRHPGVYWALCDSSPLGGRNDLYALRFENGRLAELAPGVTTRRYEVAGARNRDWEDLAIDDRGHLWIGEFGNNDERRDDLTLLELAEPDPTREGPVSVLASHPFRYPDRSWNAESLFIVGGVPHVITKTETPAIYRFPAQNETEVVLDRVAALPQPPGGFVYPPTAADVSADGTRLAVTTAGDRVWVYEARPGLRGEALVNDFAARPPRWSAPYRADGVREQVEGVSFVPGGHDLLLLSESKRMYFLAAPELEPQR